MLATASYKVKLSFKDQSNLEMHTYTHTQKLSLPPADIYLESFLKCTWRKKIVPKGKPKIQE